MNKKLRNDSVESMNCFTSWKHENNQKHEVLNACKVSKQSWHDCEVKIIGATKVHIFYLKVLWSNQTKL